MCFNTTGLLPKDVEFFVLGVNSVISDSMR